MFTYTQIRQFNAATTLHRANQSECSHTQTLYIYIYINIYIYTYTFYESTWLPKLSPFQNVCYVSVSSQHVV